MYLAMRVRVVQRRVRSRQPNNPTAGHRRPKRTQRQKKSEGAATASEHLLPAGCWAQLLIEGALEGSGLRASHVGLWAWELQ